MRLSLFFFSSRVGVLRPCWAVTRPLSWKSARFVELSCQFSLSLFAFVSHPASCSVVRFLFPIFLPDPETGAATGANAENYHRYRLGRGKILGYCGRVGGLSQDYGQHDV